MRTPRMLTFRTASKVADRSVRTLHAWRVAGMPTSFDEKGRRIVSEDELMKHKRIHLRAWPTHQYRMRRMAEEKRDTPEG